MKKGLVLLCVLALSVLLAAPAGAEVISAVDNGTNFLLELKGQYRVWDNTTNRWKGYPAEGYVTFTIAPIKTNDVDIYEDDYRIRVNAYWENYQPVAKGRYVIHMPDGDVNGQFLSHNMMEFYSYENKSYNYFWEDLYLWTYLTRADTIDFTYSDIWIDTSDPAGLEAGGYAYLYIRNEPESPWEILTMEGTYRVASRAEIRQVLNGPPSNSLFDRSMKDAIRMTDKGSRYQIHVEGTYREKDENNRWTYTPATVELESTVTPIPTNNVDYREFTRWSDKATCQQVYAYWESMSPTFTGSLTVHRSTGDETVKLSWQNLVDSGLDYQQCGDEPWALGHADFYFGKGVHEAKNKDYDFNWGQVMFGNNPTTDKLVFPESGTNVRVYLDGATSYFSTTNGGSNYFMKKTGK